MNAARLRAGALAGALTACATPSALAPRQPDPGGDGPVAVVSPPDAGTAVPPVASGPAPAAPSSTPPVSAIVAAFRAAGCATTPTAPSHPLAAALARDLKIPFASYACVFSSSSDPTVAVPGFRIMALVGGTPFAPGKTSHERRWQLVERYRVELGLSVPARQELAVADDGALHRLVQRVPGTWIGTDGFVDMQLDPGDDGVQTMIDVALVPHPERFGSGGRVTVKVAQASALAAAVADGAVPARLAKKASLALHTTASGTTLVYDFTFLKVQPTAGGLTDGPKWFVRLDASTGAVVSVRHE